ncbi:MAG: hypothetical protein LC679_12050, partial [Intrasporangiaceae bacterium]|nr:hypothetical protein [Intrasporangiaceae bacterium]
VLSSPQSTAGARVSAPGSFQDELGCTADWQPDCVVTTLTDDDGDGVFTWTTEDIPAGVVGAQDRPRPVLAGELRR